MPLQGGDCPSPGAHPKAQLTVQKAGLGQASSFSATVTCWVLGKSNKRQVRNRHSHARARAARGPLLAPTCPCQGPCLSHTPYKDTERVALEWAGPLVVPCPAAPTLWGLEVQGRRDTRRPPVSLAARGAREGGAETPASQRGLWGGRGPGPEASEAQASQTAQGKPAGPVLPGGDRGMG